MYTLVQLAAIPGEWQFNLEVGRGLINKSTVTVYGPVEKHISFFGGFRLQIDDICIAPAIIDLFYFIIFSVFSSTRYFYYVTIMACFCYFLCANIEHLAKSVYDFTHFTQVI